MKLPTTSGETFSVWAKPGAKKTELVGYHEGREAFEIRLAAVAQDNKANQELLGYLEKTYGIQCVIEHGLLGRKKVLRVR